MNAFVDNDAEITGIWAHCWQRKWSFLVLGCQHVTPLIFLGTEQNTKECNSRLKNGGRKIFDDLVGENYLFAGKLCLQIIPQLQQIFFGRGMPQSQPTRLPDSNSLEAEYHTFTNILHAAIFPYYLRLSIEAQRCPPPPTRSPSSMSQLHKYFSWGAGEGGRKMHLKTSKVL